MIHTATGRRENITCAATLLAAGRRLLALALLVAHLLGYRLPLQDVQNERRSTLSQKLVNRSTKSTHSCTIGELEMTTGLLG